MLTQPLDSLKSILDMPPPFGAALPTVQLQLTLSCRDLRFEGFALSQVRL
jgi:hypothetical protein